MSAGAATPHPLTPVPAGALRLGLCSVTLRQLPAVEVARLAADSGLRTVEWGADVHARPGNPGAVAAARAAAADHGLSVSSYGSYFRPGTDDGADFEPVAAAAVALGAPRVRIWAGSAGSADADAAGRAGVVRGAQHAADLAAAYGLELGFEFHGGTLTDTVPSTLRLLEEVDRSNVTTYWQPPLDEPVEVALRGLRAVQERVCAVHVFSWWPDRERLPLRDRADLWREVFALLRGRGRPLDALLEFVPGDDPAALGREAATLAELAGTAG